MKKCNYGFDDIPDERIYSANGNTIFILAFIILIGFLVGAIK